jgi:hypothetical protein
MCRRIFVIASICFGAYSPVCLAQSRVASADLTGSVRDLSDAVVPNARVTATHIDTNLERSTLSGSDGEFILPAMPLGLYRVRIELDGFRPEVREQIELQLGSAPHLEVTLHPAAVVETIIVEGAAPLLEPHRTVIANVISQQQIDSLPINGRNFIAFAAITGGVAPDRLPLQGATATSGLAFAGQRARSNNITVDGLDNNDETVGGVRATFSQEAVREFQVLTHSYSAEFGKASGGVVNIVTKSGTNLPSGTLFGYFRDATLNAKEHFEQFDPAGQEIDTPKAPYRQEQYGGILGGPIKRNRTFFFGSFERLAIDANNFVTIDSAAIDLLNKAGFPVTAGHVSYPVTTNQLVLKVDHNLGAGQMLNVRYNYGGGYNGNVETWGGLVAESRGAALDNRDHMLVASYTAVLSSHIVNEARAQFANRKQSLLGLDPSCAGICDADDEGGPTVEISGVADAGRNRVTPQRRDNTRYQVLDVLSYQTGRHLWKGGVDFNAVDHPNSSLPLHFGGRYIFTPLPAIPGLLPTPLTALQAFSLGLPAAYVQGFGNPEAPYLTQDVATFVQDQWRLSPSVTLNSGLRYQKQFWPARTYSVPPIGSYPIPPDSNNLAPRLGIAWDPAKDGRFRLHAAYGIYYDNIISATVGVADIVNGAPNGVRTLVLRFPQSVGAWTAPGHRLPEPPAGTYPSLIFAIDPNLKTSYSHQLSFGSERQLGSETTLSANFVYSRGFNQLGTIDFNPIVTSLGPGRRPQDIGAVAGTSASILQYTSYGESWYRGLIVSMGRRLAGRSQFLATYVLSKTEDNSSDFQSAFLPQNNGAGRNPADTRGLPQGFDPSLERGPSLQDQRHRFVFSGAYEGPYGVRLSGLVSAGSGVPFNILAGSDLNGDGDGGNFPTDRARVNPADPSTTVPRNAGRLPSEVTVDIRLSRRFRAGKASIEPLFEVFNLFNRVNYTDVNNVFGAGAFPANPLPTYGQFQRAAAPRQAQVSARIHF